jgi:hypothetical protein
VAAVCVIAGVVAGFVLTRGSGTAPGATPERPTAARQIVRMRDVWNEPRPEDARAQFRLAEAYDGGEGVPEDDARPPNGTEPRGRTGTS